MVIFAVERPVTWRPMRRASKSATDRPASLSKIGGSGPTIPAPTTATSALCELDSSGMQFWALSQSSNNRACREAQKRGPPDLLLFHRHSEHLWPLESPFWQAPTINVLALCLCHAFARGMIALADTHPTFG